MRSVRRYGCESLCQSQEDELRRRSLNILAGPHCVSPSSGTRTSGRPGQVEMVWRARNRSKSWQSWGPCKGNGSSTRKLRTLRTLQGLGRPVWAIWSNLVNLLAHRTHVDRTGAQKCQLPPTAAHLIPRFPFPPPPRSSTFPSLAAAHTDEHYGGIPTTPVGALCCTPDFSAVGSGEASSRR